MQKRKGTWHTPKSQIKDQIINVRLTKAQHAKLKRLAKADERSLSFLLRKAVDYYLSDH